MSIDSIEFNEMILERLPKCLETISTKFWQLVEMKDAEMSEGYFAWYEIWAAT
jgi:hypothetical protein